MTFADDKRALRTQVRARLRALAGSALHQAGVAVARHLEGALPSNGVVALFASRPTELDTGPLDALLRAHGLTRVVPRIEGDALAFAVVDDDVAVADLPADTLGIPTPPSTAPTVPLSSCGLVCVPGLAFDRRGGRLGYGRGFYDRALHDVADDAIVGLLCAAQWAESVPMDVHDRRIRQLVDESGWTRVGSLDDVGNHDG